MGAICGAGCLFFALWRIKPLLMLDGVDEDGTIYVNIPVGLAPWDDGEAGEE